MKLTDEERRGRRRAANRKWWATRTPEAKAAWKEREQRRAQMPEYKAKRAAAQRARREANPERSRMLARESRARHVERRRADNREYQARPEVKIKERRRLLDRYGVTLEQWLAMFDAQGRRCKCCGTDQPGSRGRWATDHDHRTGVIRGILCNACNVTLGMLGDTAEGVRAASVRFLAYLEST